MTRRPVWRIVLGCCLWDAALLVGVFGVCFALGQVSSQSEVRWWHAAIFGAVIGLVESLVRLTIAWVQKGEVRAA